MNFLTISSIFVFTIIILSNDHRLIAFLSNDYQLRINTVLLVNQNVYFRNHSISYEYNMRRSTKKYVISVFRKWSSKNYAVFSSIGKVLKIGVLAVVYLTHANTGKALVVSDTSEVVKKYQLEEIDIDGDEPVNTFAIVSRVVEVIAAKEIEAAPVQTINELLDYIQGVDIRQRGVNNVQADVSIRGGTFDQVLVLLNGVNITDPQTGHHNLNLPVNLSAIEQIEILKGPGAWRFGPGAFSGAINIITRQSSRNGLQIGTTLGNYGLIDVFLQTGFNTKNQYHNLSVNYSKSDGYITNTDFDNLTIQYNNVISAGETKFKMNLGLSDKGFGSNSFYTPKYPNQYEATRTYLASMESETKFNTNTNATANLYWRRNYDRFELFRDNPAPWYTSHNYHYTDAAGGNLFVKHRFNNSFISAGVIGRYEQIWSNVLGVNSDERKIHPIYDDASLNNNFQRTTFSAFTAYKIYVGKLSVNIGVNASFSSAYNSLYWYPGFDINYRLNQQSRLILAVNKTMRMPTFTDLFYNGPTNIGNPDLKPEQAIGGELSYRIRNDMFGFSITSFVRKGTNMIDWIKYDNEEKWHTENLSSRYISGFEFDGTLNLNRLFNTSFFQKIKFGYNYVNQSKRNEQFQSYYVMDYLKHHASLGIEHRIFKNIIANWMFNYQDRNGTYMVYKDGEYGREMEYTPFFLTDVKVAWQLKNLQVYGACTNLFDVNYFDHANIVQPGRWLKLGLKFQWLSDN